MKKIFLLQICLLYTILSFGQVTGGNDVYRASIDTSKVFKNLKVEKREIVPQKTIVFNLSYGTPIFINSLLNNEFWNKRPGSVFQFNANFKYQLFEKTFVDEYEIEAPTNFGFGVGLGISNYNKSIYFDNYSENLNNILDIDNTYFNAILNYKNINESVNLSYFDIPLFIEYGKPNLTKSSIWIQTGIKASFLIAKNFTGKGDYSSKGYYPQWDTELYNIPYLGFYNNKTAYENAEFKFSPFVLWWTLSGGVNIPLTNFNENTLSNFILKIGAKAEYSLTRISKESSDPYFSGASFRTNQSNMLGGDGARIFSLKFEIGLIYSL